MRLIRKNFTLLLILFIIFESGCSVLSPLSPSSIYSECFSDQNDSTNSNIDQAFFLIGQAPYKNTLFSINSHLTTKKILDDVILFQYTSKTGYLVYQLYSNSDIYVSSLTTDFIDTIHTSWFDKAIYFRFSQNGRCLFINKNNDDFISQLYDLKTHTLSNVKINVNPRELTNFRVYSGFCKDADSSTSACLRLAKDDNIIWKKPPEKEFSWADWSPDGTYALYTYNSQNNQFRSSNSLNYIHLNGNEVQNVESLDNICPSDLSLVGETHYSMGIITNWAPDSSKLALRCSEWSKPRTSIKLISFPKGTSKDLSFTQYLSDIAEITWLPNSKGILIHGFPAKGQFDNYYVYDLETEKVIPISLSE
jgi:hypothetical protein